MNPLTPELLTAGKISFKDDTYQISENAKKESALNF